MDYLYKQLRTQMDRQLRGRDNAEALRDQAVLPQHKEKIRKIIAYKTWFYRFWETRQRGIYSKTTFLKDEAATYVVIASPWNRIAAHEECFALAGCFPYLGHFERKDALAYAARLEKRGLVTWMRPVYAYSTLGVLEDRILSSFFHFDDQALAEMVFHELFHTLFFAKNEVELNENLADYFSEELSLLYFKRKARQDERRHVLRLKLVSLIKELDGRYRRSENLDRADAKLILERFLSQDFIPQMEATCRKLGLAPCHPLAGSWNNARFASELTYKSKGDKIRRFVAQNNFSLKQFYRHIQKSYAAYQDGDRKVSFAQYLLP